MSGEHSSQFGGYFSKKHLIKREAIALAKVLAPFFAIMGVIVYYHEFVVHAVEINKAINGLIISAATYGVILIIMRMVNAQIDFYVIERFGREAMQGVYMPQLLEQPWLKKRYVRHYLGHIAQTGGTLASALQQNAIESELHALSSEYEHKLELPQFIVGFMVAMGLLGTFVGLLETLTGISSMLDGFGGSGGNLDEQFMKLVGQLRTPLAGMGIAFSASMFGLVTSLMLAIMMINLRRYISRVVACARNVMHDLTELGRANQTGIASAVTAMNPDQIAAIASELSESEKNNNGNSGDNNNRGGGYRISGGDGGGQGGSGDGGFSTGMVTAGRVAVATISDGDQSLQDMVYQVNDTSLTVASRIDALVQKIDALMQVFEGSLTLLQRQNDLLASVPQLTENSDKIYREIKNISGGQVEQLRGLQVLAENGQALAKGQNSLLQFLPVFNELGNKILKESKAVSASQSEQQRLMQMLADSGNHTAHAQSELLRFMPGINEAGEQILNEIRSLFGGATEQVKLAQFIAQASSQSAHLARDLAVVQRDTQTNLRLFLSELEGKFSKVEAGAGSIAQNLTDLKENFSKLGAYSGMVETVSKEVGHQTLLLENLLKEDRNLQKRLVSMQQDFRERFPVDEQGKEGGEEKHEDTVTPV